MSLNEELAAFEAAVNECEKMLADGRFNVDAIEKQIRNTADPNAMIAKTGEWIGILIGQSKKIDIVRLKELKNQHPNDSRISQLGNRAAKCVLALNSIGFDVSERFAPPDVIAEQKLQNQQAIKMFEVLLSGLFSP